MSGPGVSSVICTPNGRHVVAQTTDSALAVALVRAELARREAER